MWWYFTDDYELSLTSSQRRADKYITTKNAYTRQPAILKLESKCHSFQQRHQNPAASSAHELVNTTSELLHHRISCHHAVRCTPPCPALAVLGSYRQSLGSNAKLWLEVALSLALNWKINPSTHDSDPELELIWSWIIRPHVCDRSFPVGMFAVTLKPTVSTSRPPAPQLWGVILSSPCSDEPVPLDFQCEVGVKTLTFGCKPNQLNSCLIKQQLKSCLPSL